MRLIYKIGNILHRIEQRFIADECSLRAASLAFMTSLSIVPLLSVSFTVLSAFPLVRGIDQQIQNYLFSNMVAIPGEVIKQYVEQFVQQAAKLSAVGLIFLLATALLMIFNVEQAFNVIWRVKRRRHGTSAFLLYWSVLTLIPILLGLGLTLGTYVTALPWVETATHNEWINAFLLIFAPYLSTFIAFTLLYSTVPNCKVPLRASLVGGLVATFLFQLAKYGFAVYVTQLAIYELLYGALAVIPVFLIWIYISWFIILLGAVVGHELVMVDQE